MIFIKISTTKYLAGLLAIIALFLCMHQSNGQSNKDKGESVFADHWEFVGKALEEPGYTIWGTSPICGDDGKVHLFVARWPCELKVDPGWRTHSEIAHYVGNSPEGPFRFVEVVGKGKGEEYWNAAGFHNPSIKKIDGKYVLVYIANDGAPNHGPNQRIGMLVSKSLNGPWKEVPNENEPLLIPPPDSNSWCYNSGCGVNNPAFLKHPDGRYFLYFKAMTGPRPEGKVKMGLGIADKLEGPYIIQPNPITANDRGIEDGYAFIYNGKFALLTTDNHGMIESGGGILWTSEDGIHFNTYEKGFHRINQYTNIDMKQVAVHYGPQNSDYAKFERPQILMKDGKPAYLYAPSGINIYGGDCTVSYVLKFKSE
jgi:hypothetical protein